MSTTTIIGRDAEKKILQEMLDSREAELIAVLGRRRVGKTFSCTGLLRASACI